MNNLEKLQSARDNKNYSSITFDTYFDQEDNVRVNVSLSAGNLVYSVKFPIFSEDFTIDDGEDEEIYGSYYTEEFFVDIDCEEQKKSIRDFLFQKAVFDANELVTVTKDSVIERVEDAVKTNQLDLFRVNINYSNEYPRGYDDFATAELIFENDQLKLPVADVLLSTNTYEPTIDQEGKISTWVNVMFHIPIELSKKQLDRFYLSVCSGLNAEAIDKDAEHVRLCSPMTENSERFLCFEHKSQEKGGGLSPLQSVVRAYYERDASAFCINAFQGDYRDLYAEVSLLKGDAYLGIVQFTIDQDNDVVHDEHCQYFEYAELSLDASELSSEIYDYLYELARSAVDDIAKCCFEIAENNAEHALKMLEVDEVSYDYGYLSSLKKTYIHVYYVDDLYCIEMAELVYEEHTHYFEPDDKTLVDIRYHVPCQLTDEQETRLSEIALEMYEALLSEQEEALYI